MAEPRVIIEIHGELTQAAAADAMEGERRWVVVKGWHDSGTIEAVYGPFAKWLMAGLLEYSSSNLTLIELQDGPPCRSCGGRHPPEWESHGCGPQEPR